MVSEKDQRIAVLEMAGAKKHKKDIDELNRERENDLQALKEQVSMCESLSLLTALVVCQKSSASCRKSDTNIHG